MIINPATNEPFQTEIEPLKTSAIKRHLQAQKPISVSEESMQERSAFLSEWRSKMQKNQPDMQAENHSEGVYNALKVRGEAITELCGVS